MYTRLPRHHGPESRRKSRRRQGNRWVSATGKAFIVTRLCCGWYEYACTVMPSADGRRTCCLQKKPMSCRDKDLYDNFWIMNPLRLEVWLFWTSQHLLQNTTPQPPPPEPSELVTELLTLLLAQQFASKTNANYQCRHSPSDDLTLHGS